MHNKINKKAQVSDTITWLVATVIIIVILAVAIFTVNLAFHKESSKTFKQTDVLASKSLFSYLLTKDSDGKTVYSQLRDEENLNQFNGVLGQKIFKDMYKKDYATIWFGLFTGEKILTASTNEYFGARMLKEKEVLISQNIIVNDKKNIQLDLSKSIYTK